MHSKIPTTIHEKLAWVHRDAVTLQADDLVELKHSLTNLIEKSTGLLEAVRVVLHEQRRAKMGGSQ